MAPAEAESGARTESDRLAARTPQAPNSRFLGQPLQKRDAFHRLLQNVVIHNELADLLVQASNLFFALRLLVPRAVLMATKERAYLANKNWRMLICGTATGELFVAPHKPAIVKGCQMPATRRR